MANSTSMSDVLRAIKEKSASLASGTTSARDMVYIAKGMESLYGADMLMGMLESAGKPAAVKEITDTTNNIELSIEDVSRDIVTIRNPVDSSRRAYKEFAAANVVTSDIFKLTFNGLGPNGTGTAVFNSAGGATPSEEQVVDEFVSRINNDANWVVYTGGQTFNYTVSRSSGTKADGASGDVFFIDGVERPALKLQKGNTYVFDVSDSSLNNYEFGFQTDTTGGAQFLTGVTQSAAAQGTAGSTLTVVVPNDAPATLWYADGDNATQADRYLMGNNVNVDPSETFTVYERAVVASRDATSDNLIIESLYAGAKYEIDVTATSTLTSGSTATWGEVTAVALDGRDKIHRTPYINVIVPKYGFSCVIRNEINAELRVKTSGSKDAEMLIIEPSKDHGSVKAFIASDGNSIEEVFTINGNTTPTTTKGDMEVNYGTGLGLQRLPIGDANQVLEVSPTAGIPYWNDPRGQSGDDFYGPKKVALDWVKNKGEYDTYIELPPRTTDYFSGTKVMCPWTSSQYSNNTQGQYSGLFYKTNDGTLWHQGQTTGYNIGDEVNTRHNRAVSFPPDCDGKEVLYVESAYGMTAVIFEDGSVAVSGSNATGALGFGNTTSTTNWSTSTRWDGTSPNTKVKKWVFSNGNDSYCTTMVLAEDGTVWVSGYNSNGSSGINGTVYSFTQVTGLSSYVIDNIWSGGGIRSNFWAWDSTNQKMYAWGSNQSGGLGIGTTTNATVPTAVTSWPTGKQPKSIHMANYQGTDNTSHTNTTVVLMTDGTVYGTGNNNYMQLCNGNTNNRNTLGPVGTTGSGVQLTGSSDATTVQKLWSWSNSSAIGYFARMKDGSSVCWGYNGSYDWMGRGDTSNNNYPSEVLNITGPTNIQSAITVGSQYNDSTLTVALITDDGKIWTSGYNYNGFAGIGDSSTSYGNITPHGTTTSYGWKRPFDWSRQAPNYRQIMWYGYTNSSRGWWAPRDDNRVTCCGYNGHYVTPTGDNSQEVYYPWRLRIGSR